MTGRDGGGGEGGGGTEGRKEVGREGGREGGRGEGEHLEKPDGLPGDTSHCQKHPLFRAWRGDTLHCHWLRLEGGQGEGKRKAKQ